MSSPEGGLVDGCAAASLTGDDDEPPEVSSCARMLPHEGIVYLDGTPTGQWVTNVKTLERKCCPEGHTWQLTFLGGFGALSADDSDDVLLLEDRLECNLFEGRKEGRPLVLPSDGSNTLVRDLATWQRSYKEVALHFSGAMHLGDVMLDGYSLEWPRMGSAFVVEAQQLYSLLKLKSYKGQGSKCCYQSVASWNKMLAGTRCSGRC